MEKLYKFVIYSIILGGLFIFLCYFILNNILWFGIVSTTGSLFIVIIIMRILFKDKKISKVTSSHSINAGLPTTFKKYYWVSYIINIILILVILFLYIHYSDYLKRSLTEKLEEGDEVFFQHSLNTYKVKIPLNNIIIGQTFNKLPSKSKIEIYDTNFNLIGTYFDDNITYSADKKERLYGKISKSVKFKENNATETKYTWILFEIDPNSKDTLDFIVDYSPAIWEEEPSLKWKN